MDRARETVILLHGILKSRFDMAFIEAYLKREGYQTINLSYPSRLMNIAQLSDFLHEKLSAMPEFNDAAKVHFVTHSMGGLLARYYIHHYRPPNLGSAVMLGPPNQGSEFANFMMEYEKLSHIFNRIFGPAGAELRTDHKHISEKVDFPLGIIAGSASINPLAPWVLAGHKGNHDGIVPVERTKIEGMTDHIVIPATHALMVLNPQVLKETLHFLRHGCFSHAPVPKARLFTSP